MLKSGVLILTLKLPSPNRLPMSALLDGALGAGAGAGGSGALGAGATMTGVGAGTTRGTAGTRTRPITRPPELDWRPVLAPALAPLPETTELTVWDTSGVI